MSSTIDAFHGMSKTFRAYFSENNSKKISRWHMGGGKLKKNWIYENTVTYAELPF